MKQTFETKETILVAAEKAVREYQNINECYYKESNLVRLIKTDFYLLNLKC